MTTAHTRTRDAATRKRFATALTGCGLARTALITFFTLVFPLGFAIGSQAAEPAGITTLTATDHLPTTPDSPLHSALPNPLRFIDSRAATACRDKTLAGALCLPPEDIFADQHRLANFSGLFWLLGTADLTGSETVIIIGDNLKRKRTLAGWLYASGQAHVVIDTESLTARVNRSSDDGGKNTQVLSTGAGQSRSSTRTSVFTATPRTHKLLTRSEIVNVLGLDTTNAARSAITPLSMASAHQETNPIAQTSAQQLPPATNQVMPLIDGRSESEYWGRRIRGSRGGHIPGAILLDAPSTARVIGDQVVLVYGHNAQEGFALLAQLTAQGIDTRVYLNGWAEWSNQSNLPVDAEVFADTQKVAKTSHVKQHDAANSSATAIPDFSNTNLLSTAVWVLLALTLINFAGVIFLGFRQQQYR